VQDVVSAVARSPLWSAEFAEQASFALFSLLFGLRGGSPGSLIVLTLTFCCDLRALSPFSFAAWVLSGVFHVSSEHQAALNAKVILPQIPTHREDLHLALTLFNCS
jgi:hypothetical protein